MNEYAHEARRRHRTLLIVEGNHEKNKLFWLLFQCFPEIDIDMEDIWIYGTNIYMLYTDILKEYGIEHIGREDDIDLPFVASKKQHPDSLCYKEDFTNILLVFDYERHDTNFSENKILEMQEYFCDAADMGKLYLNYPMIESYQHLRTLPDDSYAERKVPVSLQPGKKYKALVRTETAIRKEVGFPHKIESLLEKQLGISDKQMRQRCCDEILSISSEQDIDSRLQELLQKAVELSGQETIKNRLKDWILKLGYLHTGQTYWKYMREIFKTVICHNICKANKIQNGRYQVEEDSYKACFEHLDLTEILKVQNRFSREIDSGYIWVLNTCVFLVADYNFALVTLP